MLLVGSIVLYYFRGFDELVLFKEKFDIFSFQFAGELIAQPLQLIIYLIDMLDEFRFNILPFAMQLHLVLLALHQLLLNACSPYSNFFYQFVVIGTQFLDALLRVSLQMLLVLFDAVLDLKHDFLVKFLIEAQNFLPQLAQPCYGVLSLRSYFLNALIRVLLDGGLILFKGVLHGGLDHVADGILEGLEVRILSVLNLAGQAKRLKRSIGIVEPNKYGWLLGAVDCQHEFGLFALLVQQLRSIIN